MQWEFRLWLTDRSRSLSWLEDHFVDIATAERVVFVGATLNSVHGQSVHGPCVAVVCIIRVCLVFCEIAQVADCCSCAYVAARFGDILPEVHVLG